MASIFKDKVAVVTGAASGLGEALARELIKRGSIVVLADISVAKAQQIADELGERAHAATVDVSKPEQISALVREVSSKYGSLDLFFNNAGTSNYGEATDLPFSEWERVIRVNLMGVIAGTLYAYEVMKKQGSGRIVNIGSASVFTCDPLFGPYVTSKYGVVGFSRVLAVEAEAFNVQVSVVCPGNIRTPLLDQREPSWLTPAIPVAKAAMNILRSVERSRRIIVFPFRWRLIWWMDRISPNLLLPLRRVIVKRARARTTQT